MEPSVLGIPTVEDAARDLLSAARALQDYRREADRIVADLETRWAENRMRQQLFSPTPRRG